jgi:hypothetical protein
MRVGHPAEISTGLAPRGYDAPRSGLTERGLRFAEGALGGKVKPAVARRHDPAMRTAFPFHRSDAGGVPGRWRATEHLTIAAVPCLFSATHVARPSGE